MSRYPNWQRGCVQNAVMCGFESRSGHSRETGRKEVRKMPTIDMIATGTSIMDKRVKAGMTVADVTNACGVSAAAVCKWQSGQTIPSIDNMVILAAIWNCKINDIIVVQAV